MDVIGYALAKKVDLWTTKTAMPTARRGLAAAAPGNGKLYAVGGIAAANLATNEEYDPGMPALLRWLATR